MTRMFTKKPALISKWLCVYFWLACLTGCQNSTSNSMSNDEWMRFGGTLVEAGRAKNGDRLMNELSFMDMKELERLVSQQSGLKMPTREEVEKGTKEAIEVFLRSYEDLFDGELACVTAADFDVRGMESLKSLDPKAVIVWVKKGDKYQGIKIHVVVKTSEGLRVMDWLGDHGYPSSPGAELWKKTAILESPSLESCRYPSTIDYKYEYKGGSGDSGSSNILGGSSGLSGFSGH